MICLAVVGVATAGVLHGGHGGHALYAAAPAAYAHGAHPDEGLDYHVSKKWEIYIAKDINENWSKLKYSKNESESNRRTYYFICYYKF